VNMNVRLVEVVGVVGVENNLDDERMGFRRFECILSNTDA
jgi:hypothetical protein